MSILNKSQYSYLTEKQSFLFRIWKIIFYYYCKVVFLIYTPVKVLGRDNIPNEPSIFCSNHNSHMDVALIAHAARKSFNHFGMLAAVDYWFDSSIKRVLTNLIMNLIPISRKSENRTDAISFDETIALCNSFMELDKRNLIIFPEGSRGKPNVMKNFRKGAARFSLALNKPIVPIYIGGSSKSWPKGKIFMRPCKITINILEPIDPNDYISNQNDNVLNAKQLTTVLEEKIMKESKKHINE